MTQAGTNQKVRAEMVPNQDPEATPRTKAKRPDPRVHMTETNLALSLMNDDTKSTVKKTGTGTAPPLANINRPLKPRHKLPQV